MPFRGANFSIVPVTTDIPVSMPARDAGSGHNIRLRSLTISIMGESDIAG